MTPCVETHRKKLIEIWLDKHNSAVVRPHQLIDDMRAEGQVDLAMLTVANAQLRSLLNS